MTEINNDKLNKVVGGTGVENSGFKVGDWVYPKKIKLSPQGMPTYYRIDDIEEPDSRMPRYVVSTYVKDLFDGSISKVNTLGSYFAEELGYGHDPTLFDDLQ